MSDTTVTTPPVSPEITPVKPESDRFVNIISEYGKVAVSILVAVIFALALWITYKMGDKAHDAFVTLIGVAASSFTAAVQYWIGSSFGSSKKTDIISNSPGVVTVPTPNISVTNPS